MKKKKSVIKDSAKERRKKFNDWFSKEMYYKSQGKIVPIWPKGTKIPKVMSNEDRRKLGLEQDPEIEDFKK